MLTPLACNPFAIPPAEHERHAEVAQAMLAAVQTWRELPDGYALRFATELAVTQNLVEFISRERLCCPFFNFRLEYPAAETNAVWLSLTGAEGVKAFIQSEFNLEGVPHE